MIDFKKVAEMNVPPTYIPPKTIVYSNPAMVLLPLTEPMINYVRQRLGVSNISFMKNLCNYYFTGGYIDRCQKSEGVCTTDRMLGYNDGMSMAEIASIITTRFDAYFNPAVVSLQFNPIYWQDVLLTATKLVNYQYLDVSYKDYSSLCVASALNEVSIIDKDSYEEASLFMVKFVDEMNFLSTSRQHSDKIH